jgi:8-oxo-dGTP pyrophosphatase MutT (NUDIX family)
MHVTRGEPVPSATTVLLRCGRVGLEVLLVRRHRRLAFHGGAWVFPGGRVDAADLEGHANQPGSLPAARRAACRETREETGLTVPPEDLVPISRWTTPPGRPRRFRTWFFLASAGDDRVRVDGFEISDHRWVRPADAVLARAQGEMDLPPPTFVTLVRMARYASVQDTLADHMGRAPQVFTPRPRSVPGGLVSLYEGDTAYGGSALDSPGPRHRLWMTDTDWLYEHDAE